MNVARLAIALVFVLGTGCSPKTGAAGGASPLGRSVITEDELAANEGGSLYDLIRRIRPEYLRPRPVESTHVGNGVGAPLPAVMVNGQVTGDVNELRQVAPSTLSRVRYYPVEEAKRKFGMQLDTSVIELTYRAATPPVPDTLNQVITNPPKPSSTI